MPVSLDSVASADSMLMQVAARAAAGGGDQLTQSLGPPPIRSPGSGGGGGGGGARGGGKQRMKPRVEMRDNKRVMQVVLINRTAGEGMLALPGGMKEEGQGISATLRKEFIEEALGFDSSMREGHARGHHRAATTMPFSARQDRQHQQPSPSSVALKKQTSDSSLQIRREKPGILRGGSGEGDGSKQDHDPMAKSVSYLQQKSHELKQREGTNTPRSGKSKQGDTKKDAKEMVRKFFSKGDVLYKGYAADPRNTDNAWMETWVEHYHDESGEKFDKFNLRAGDDAGDVKWVDVDRSLKLYGQHWHFLKLAAERHNAHW